MLVLTRKVDQPIRINDNIEVRVLEIRGNRVRLGIVAPADVTIKRQETIDQLTFQSPEGFEISAELIHT